MTLLHAPADGSVATVWDERAASVRWARRAFDGGTVVLAVQTTDLFLSVSAVCEVAVIDTAGQNLLDTLINPRVPVTQSAQKFHHLRDEMLSGAPAFGVVLADLLAVTAGRTVAAYNAGFVKAVLLGECGKAGMDPEHFEDGQIWRCISQARSAAAGHPDHHWPLEGGARASGACHAALQVLRSVADGRADVRS